MSVEPKVAVGEEFDLQIPSGRLHAKRYGPAKGGLVLAAPGLSANLVSFDFLGERLGPLGMNLVALDLRGRGKSDVTPVGTYGWRSHAADLIAAAKELGHERFSVLGQSMGGAVAMTCAWLHPGALERVVLLDICGVPDEKSLLAIGASVARLGTVYPSIEQYLELLQSMHMIEPWSEYWERYFRYELQPTEGGVTSRSNRQAVLEDSAWGAGAAGFGDASGIYGLWKHLDMPVLLLRASQEILPGFGRIVSDRDRERFAQEVATAKVVDVDGNHFTVNTHEDSAKAIASFFGL